LWRFVEQWPQAARRSASTVVVGAGAAGIELALALQASAKAQGGAARVTVVGDTRVIAAGLARQARIRLHRLCVARGISLELGARVARVTNGTVELENGTVLAAHTIVWATGPAPQAWLRDTGLALDERGYLSIDQHLRVGSRAEVYAAGDVASIVGHPRPKAGVYAVREAPLLVENLRRALHGQDPRTYIPQRRALALIGTADGRAVAAYGPLSAQGAWVWRWKDSIDRRFVQRYRY
jgi:selenide,water dikinase